MTEVQGHNSSPCNFFNTSFNKSWNIKARGDCKTQWEQIRISPKKIYEYNRNAISVRNEEISRCNFSINPLKKSSYTKEKINENLPNLMEMHIHHILMIKQLLLFILLKKYSLFLDQRYSQLIYE